MVRVLKGRKEGRSRNEDEDDEEVKQGGSGYPDLVLKGIKTEVEHFTLRGWLREDHVAWGKLRT